MSFLDVICEAGVEFELFVFVYAGEGFDLVLFAGLKISETSGTNGTGLSCKRTKIRENSFRYLLKLA